MKKILLAFLLPLTTLVHAQYPQDFSLKNLEDNYISSKACEDICGTTLGLTIKSIDLSSSQITFEIPVSASKLTMIAMPFTANEFIWKEVLLNNKPLHAITIQAEKILIAVPPGNHTITLKANLIEPSYRANLNSDPKNFENKSVVEASIRKNGERFFLEIPRAQNAKKNQQEDKSSGLIVAKPVYKIERVLILSDKWRLKTTISSLLRTQSNQTTTVIVPLVEGEKPLNNELEIKDGKVYAEMNGNSLQWESAITPQSKLVFKNQDEKNAEFWTIMAQNNWVYSSSGISPILSSSNQEYKSIKTWAMWPKESIEVHFSMPKSIEGQVTNVTNFLMEAIPQTQPSEYKINASITSSVGGRYVINFDNKKAELVSLKLNNIIVPNKINNGLLSLDLYAGSNTLELIFKSGEEQKIFTKMPYVKFETPVTNATFKKNIDSRWLLFTGGGDIKPVVLIWGMLIGFSILAIFLAKSKQTPLMFGSWLLLLLGLSQSSMLSVVLVTSWFFLFAWRYKLDINKYKQSPTTFNGIQVILSIWTISSIIILISIVASGLLSEPTVFVKGYDSYGTNLNWYIQTWHSDAQNPWIISTPMWVYRMLMMSWSIWLAFNLLSWMKWMWHSYSAGGWWINQKESISSSSQEDEQKIATKNIND